MDSIHEVDREAWNACLDGSNPFLTHQFFSCLEDSGCACHDSGWTPHHLVWSRAGQIRAIAPLFLKTHSEGEFVFDYAWAEAYQRLGGNYYPKLQSCVPYTPVTGPRYLLHPQEENPGEVRRILAQSQLELARHSQASSVHVTFSQECEFAESQGPWLQRLGIQFHFPNPGYRDFSDFLSQLSARKRKSILKERKAIQESGLELETLSGSDIKEVHIDLLHRCYLDTCSRKWGRAALNRRFFELLRERLPEFMVLMVARRGQDYLAAALNFKGSSSLFGRNWGALEDISGLHFELCYYRAIDYALAQGLERVEAGAQGFHKVARGYLPQLTYSQHWLADTRFSGLVERFLQEEREAVKLQVQQIEEEHSPYRKIAP